MAVITAKMVQELREKTGAGPMDCKKALTESEADMDKAVKILREKGLAAAANRSSKTAAEGLIRVLSNATTAVIAEINCETDFVTRNENFIQFVDNTTAFILESKSKSIDCLNSKEIKGVKFSEQLAEFAAKIGENIKVRRFNIFELSANESFASYLHGGGKIGVLLKYSLSDISKKDESAIKEFAKDLCMQIAAAEPKYITAEDVTKDDLDNERSIYVQQMKNEGKPEQIINKIVEGKIVKYYEQVCLVDQVFIKDQTKKIKDIIVEIAKQTGAALTPIQFLRFKVGEGIEKKVVDFAAEVQAQLQSASGN